MRRSGPEPWPTRRWNRYSVVAGLLIGLMIVAVLAWVVGMRPRPGWREPAPPVPVAPAPAPSP